MRRIPANVTSLFFLAVAVVLAAQQPKEPVRSPGASSGMAAPLEKKAPDRAGLEAGAVTVNPQNGQKYAWIPPGTFQMGCSPGDSDCDEDEKPGHSVTILKGFWIGQTDVKVAAYRRFALTEGLSMPSSPDFNPSWKFEEHPIVNVTWDEAAAYCRWAGGRLPTEAEWEYAARGAQAGARYGDLDAIAWHGGNSGNATHEVAQKQANRFGLYDMLGNAWEWVGDWYGENYYAQSPSQDPHGPLSGQFRVLRGGSWNLYPWDVRVSNRVRLSPGVRYSSIGFRCVREGL